MGDTSTGEQERALSPSRVVLLVEDDLVVKLLVRKWIYEIGHACVACDSPGEACEVLEQCGDQVGAFAIFRVFPSRALMGPARFGWSFST